ncbi:LysR family transcriptional regulator [Pararhizobium antarcticum]|uniref:HTH-type transcriptional regulator TtuA n=1 Tax=Pararhizobium antarcticum TaxID=1798805 RepID=A0A657LWD5_9HYPH|nr:LysR family transcriptional regulator [Pararhizobium antarcticum]OJF96772.1 LysR family transcriptional regulator [Pararhizobium antarcticum]OJF98946.1 LysR family transcriptional regulator [Rhizobium sp. 58]
MNDLPLADLDAFTAVARERNFRAAARLRGVSASSLSEALRRLELRLGVRLLNRTTRSVTLTEAGEQLLERLSPALSEVAAALDQVGSFRDSATGTLRLNVATIVARVVLPGIIADFLHLYPGITLEVIAEDNFIDVLAAGFDAGVRYGEMLEKDMIAVPIGPRRQRFVIAASPAYLEAHGEPQHPRDILDHACIRHRFASGRVAPWEFERGGETVRLSPRARITANTLEVEIGAAIAGLGIIATFEEFVGPAIDRGELVPILEDWMPDFPGPYLYYASRRHMPPPLMAFVDFLKALPRP